MHSPSDKTIFLEQVKTNEVITAFLTFFNGKAIDALGIQIVRVKYAINVIVLSLTHFLNLSLSSGIFSDSMEISKVTAIFKKGNETDKANCHPISVLPVFTKGLEKIS